MTETLHSYFDAVAFSYLMHKGQRRRDLDIPYWTHVSLVSSTVAEWGGDVIQIMAALGHDLLEDTDAIRETIDMLQGRDVADVIEGMTGSKDPAIKWEARKLQYVITFLDGLVVDRTYLVKLADMHANMTSFSNTAVRTGKPSAKSKTINCYVALVHICLEGLKQVGAEEQYRVAEYNIKRMLNRVIETGVCPDAELLYRMNDADAPTNGAEWYKALATIWNLL